MVLCDSLGAGSPRATSAPPDARCHGTGAEEEEDTERRWRAQHAQSTGGGRVSPPAAWGGGGGGGGPAGAGELRNRTVHTAWGLLASAGPSADSRTGRQRAGAERPSSQSLSQPYDLVTGRP